MKMFAGSGPERVGQVKKQLHIPTIVLIFITILFFGYSKFAFADVTEIEYESPSFVETDSTESDQNQSEDTGDSRNWFEKLLDLAKKKWDDTKEYIQDEWEKFKDWSYEKWEDFKEWAPEAWDKVTDWFWDGLNAIGDFFVMVWENEWVQVVVGAVVATGVIIGGLLLVGTPIGWGILAVVGGGALLGGGIYKLLAGDNFSFLGSLLSSFGGGLAGLGIFAGVTSGFFAVAGNATRIFLVNNFVKARLWGSLAIAVMRQNLVNSWTTLMLHTRVGLSMWGAKIASGAATLGSQAARLAAFITSKVAPHGWKALGLKAAMSSSLGAAFNGLIYLFGTSFNDWALNEFVFEVLFGGVSGALLSPFFFLEKMTWGAATFLSLYGGVENYIYEGLKNGEWTWQNAAIGAIAGAIVVNVVSPMLNNGTKLFKGLLNGGKTDLNPVDDIIVDNMTKPFGADLRSDLNDIFDNYDINGQNEVKDVSDHKLRPDPQIEPKQTPDMDPQLDRQPEPQPEPSPDQQPDPKPEPQPEPKPEPQPEPKPEPQPEPKPEPQSEPKPELQPDPKPEPQPEPKPEPQPDSSPDQQPEPKPEPQPDSSPDQQPEPKPEPQPDSSPDQQPDPKPEPQPDPKPEPQSDQASDKPEEVPNDGQKPDGGEDKENHLDEDENDDRSTENVNDHEKESGGATSENQSSTTSNRFDRPQPAFAE
ncbi:hypothetical protein MHZ95_14505 [Sporosarcina sp. ACRSM]|uniref:hypothetical protein n=1 Tax=Sporosarcina sp. ACRSM TaxID=2918216 RepID=UPI001EF429D6|nr:hypothetical protein [Sporosarcina sp. ACRSM]MCG7336478.1 hypothetical protein [Sporosarcina sp. ACRSM]